MDQGTTCALKAKYWSLAVHKLMKERIQTISILSAMIRLEKAWYAVSNKTFINCFKNACISKKEVERVLKDKDSPLSDLDDIKEDSFQTLRADLAFLKKRFDDQVDHKIKLDEYIDFDIEVSTTHWILTNQEIE